METGRITIVMGGLVLLAGLALVVLGSIQSPERTFNGSVRDLLPAADEVTGWTVEYLPIADTPEMKAKVEDLLNYDDAVFAVYRGRQLNLSVYIAYWAPGKMSPRLIAGHTPDVCWVAAGWKILEARSGVSMPDGEGGYLLRAEKRTMALNGRIEHVAFWHILDGEPMNYGTGSLPPWHAFIGDLLSRKLNQKPEQFFIRISSDVAFTRWPFKTVDDLRLLKMLRQK